MIWQQGIAAVGERRTVKCRLVRGHKTAAGTNVSRPFAPDFLFLALLWLFLFVLVNKDFLLLSRHQ